MHFWQATSILDSAFHHVVWEEWRLGIKFALGLARLEVYLQGGQHSLIQLKLLFVCIHFVEAIVTYIDFALLCKMDGALAQILQMLQLQILALLFIDNLNHHHSQN